MKKWLLVVGVAAAAIGSALTWSISAGSLRAHKNKERVLASAMDSTRQQLAELSRQVRLLQDSLEAGKMRQRAQQEWEGQAAEERAIREENKAIREGIEAQGISPARQELMEKLQREAMGGPETLPKEIPMHRK
jgi:hypothetical protein